jgi:negative regulator of flagellin synthesis FlgM
MTIGRIGQFEPIQPGREGGRNGRVERRDVGDSVSISTEAKEQADFLRALDVVKETPDVRQERVSELKKKINDPAYIDEILVRETANRVMRSLGL